MKEKVNNGHTESQEQKRQQELKKKKGGTRKFYFGAPEDTKGIQESQKKNWTRNIQEYGKACIRISNQSQMEKNDRCALSNMAPAPQEILDKVILKIATIFN